MKPCVLSIIFLFLFSAAFFALPLHAGELNGNTVNFSVSELEEAERKDIADGDYSTVYKADALKLTLLPEENVQAVYIIWNEPPAEYTVCSDGEKITVGDGFMHRLVTFSSAVGSVSLDGVYGGEICDIYMFRDSDLPEWVQKWEPPCKRADLLVFSAHADDEFLMFGGTIPYYAKESDLKVQAVYMTTHWEEQPRPHEMLDGLWTAGVENYPITGIIPDIPYQPIFTLSEAAELYDFDAVLEWFTEQIRRFKPSVIVTHDLKGEYGHAAHKLAAKTVTDAVEISFDPSYYTESAEKYGVWNVPKTYLHFYGENAVQMDWESPLESFGGITARDAAALCYGKHKSQHIWGYSVNYGENWDCRQFGLYRSLVGNDTEADFMDNITPLTEEEKSEEESETETNTGTEIETEKPDVYYTEADEKISKASGLDTEPNAPNTDTAEPERRELDRRIAAAAAAVILAVPIILLTVMVKKRKSKGNTK